MSSQHSPTISPQALQRLLDARAQFLAFVERQVGSRAAAEDILQAAFARGLERGGGVRDSETVIAWFYRVLRNAIVDHYRRNAAAQRAQESWARELELLQEPPDPFKQEVCRCVSGLLQTLKPEYREALEVVDLGDGSLRQLSERSGISAGNAAVRVHRARQALRKQVTRACGACAEHGCLECTCRSTHPPPA